MAASSNLTKYLQNVFATLRVKLLALESEPDVRAPTGTRRDVSAGSLGAVQGADCVYSHIGLASWGYVEPKYPN